MLGKCFFSRDPERPFDTERPRNWGSFGAELNGLKPWRRGGFRCFLGGWLVVENASNFFSIGIQSVRLTPNVRGIGARLEQNSMGSSCGEGVVSDAFWEAG